VNRTSVLTVATALSLSMGAGHAAPAANAGGTQDAGHRTKPTAGRVRALTGENILVSAHALQSANGVTGTTPGGGMMVTETSAHSVTTISRDFIAKLAPATSAAQIAEYAPGANIGSSDPFGLSDQTAINIRGMQASELGYLYDGAPIADVDSSIPYTSQWGDTENYRQISLTPGQSPLDAPLTNATAGTLSLETSDPAMKRGGLIDYSYGSHMTNRSFVRLESGLIGHTGLRGYISYSNTTFRPWRGAGIGNRQHVDAKLLREWGEGSRQALDIAFNTNNQPSYNNVTMAQWQAFGPKGPNNFTEQYDPTNPSSYWKVNVGGFSNIILTAPGRYQVTRALRFDVLPYFYWGAGASGYGETIGATGNYIGTAQFPGSLQFPQPSLQNADGTYPVQAAYFERIFHPGLNLSARYQFDSHNTTTLGWWYDYSDDLEQQTYNQLGADGAPSSYWASQQLRNAYGQILYGVNYHLISQTNGIYLAHRMSYLADRLQVELGFKEAIVNRTGTNALPGPQYHVGMNTAEPLPRGSASFRIDPHNQIYGSVSTNFKMPSAPVYFDVYDGAGNGSPGGVGVRNEYAVTEEIGYRHTGVVNVSASLFNTEIHHRNIASSIYTNGFDFGTTINGGNQRLRGADLEFSTRPWHHLSPYIAAEYLDSRMQSNLGAAGVDADGDTVNDTLPTRGRQSVLAPKWTVSAALSYDDGTIFGNVMYRWIDAQYADFMNQEQLPAHGQVDTTLGLRLPDISFFKHPQIQLNLYNLGSARYLSGVSTVSSNALDTTGIRGSTIPGSSPYYYVASTFAAMATVTTGF
jgi:iron complex outermembrane recepter protein